MSKQIYTIYRRFKAAYAVSCCLVLTALSLVSCADEGLVEKPEAQSAISFAMSAENQTRASVGLETYVKDFRVYGVNGKLEGSSWSTQNKVMENYVVWWNANSAHSTNTNTQDWDYVGNYVGGGDRQSAFSDDEKLMIAKQSIKYWDYEQPYHIFWGVANAGGKQFVPEADGRNVSLLVRMDENNRLYYTDPVVVKKANYANTVQMPFICAQSRIRFAFYETIRGYAVKEVKFYPASGADAGSDCLINGYFVSSSDFRLTYDLNANESLANPKALWTTTVPEKADSHTFGPLNYTFAAENRLNGTTEADRIYLGKLSSDPTYAGSADEPGYYTYILPNPDNTTPLSLRCSYILVSTDGGGQEIKISDAKATIPAEYCQWTSNHSYTYLFKLTDNDLEPITFVAYSETSNTTDNQQGTITTIGDYNITTFQKESANEGGIEYKINKDMEVSVVLHNESGAKDVTLNGTTDYIIIYHQKTNKEWIVETDISEDTTPKAGVYKETLEGDGTTDGYDAQGKAHFIPDVTGTYRIEYWHKDNSAEPQKLAVKIVKIKGEEVTLDEYDKWQSGSSGTAEW